MTNEILHKPSSWVGDYDKYKENSWEIKAANIGSDILSNGKGPLRCVGITLSSSSID
jgi:hypothetical protein